MRAPTGIMDNNNFGHDQFNMYGPSGKISIGGTDGPREITVSGVGGIPPNFQDYWIDRASYQTQLTDRLKDNAVTEIVALGGFGKSSLAAWAHEDLSVGFEKRGWMNFGRGRPSIGLRGGCCRKLAFRTKTQGRMRRRWCGSCCIRLNDPNVPVKTLVVMDQVEAIQQADDFEWFQEFLNAWAADGRSSRILVPTRSRRWMIEIVGRSRISWMIMVVGLNGGWVDYNIGISGEWLWGGGWRGCRWGVLPLDEAVAEQEKDGSSALSLCPAITHEVSDQYTSFLIGVVLP